VIVIHAQPRAARTGWAGLHGGALKLRVHAPPVEGRANEEIQRFLADYFGLARRDVEWLAGESSREKRLLLRAMTAQKAHARLLADHVLS